MALKSKGKRGIGFGAAALTLATSLVVYFEGVELVTYTDPVGIPTVCVGETAKHIVMRERFTRDECMVILNDSMRMHMVGLTACIDVPVAPHEAAALVSWSYNIGVNAACNSTLVAKLNAGAPPSEWCGELARWIYAKGKRLQGLVNRRQAEYNMCMTGAWK